MTKHRTAWEMIAATVLMVCIMVFIFWFLSLLAGVQGEPQMGKVAAVKLEAKSRAFQYVDEKEE